MGIIKLLYFEGCPNAEKARLLLRQTGVTFEEVRQDDLAAIDPLKGYTSPTVLDGEKIVFGSKTGEGSSGCSFGLPSTEELRDKFSVGSKITSSSAGDQIENKSGWFVGSGILASLIASACCIGPLILTLLGVSGAAFLAKLEVLRWPMIILVSVLFCVAGFSLFKNRNSCEPSSLCADPKKFRKMVIFYWVGLLAAILAITSPQWILLLFS